MKPDFTELWEKICVEDDSKAFEAFYYALFNKLIKFCIYYVKIREPAEEIVSEIFVKCWNNRKALTHVDHPETYLFIAVKNQSLKYIKKYSNIHLVEIEPNEIRLVNISDPSKEMERKELGYLLDQAIETLPMQARMVFRLIREDGLKYKEVAEILNISPRTVQTQLFRAIAKLRLVLQNQYTPGTRHNYQNKFFELVLFIILLNYFIYL